jgi:hypothetical protein
VLAVVTVRFACALLLRDGRYCNMLVAFSAVVLGYLLTARVVGGERKSRRAIES